MMYRVEIRLDVEASSEAEVSRRAFELAEQIGGEVTEILNENWEEVEA